MLYSETFEKQICWDQEFKCIVTDISVNVGHYNNLSYIVTKLVDACNNTQQSHMIVVRHTLLNA